MKKLQKFMSREYPIWRFLMMMAVLAMITVGSKKLMAPEKELTEFEACITKATQEAIEVKATPEDTVKILKLSLNICERDVLLKEMQENLQIKLGEIDEFYKEMKHR